MSIAAPSSPAAALIEISYLSKRWNWLYSALSIRISWVFALSSASVKNDSSAFPVPTTFPASAHKFSHEGITITCFGSSLFDTVGISVYPSIRSKSSLSCILLSSSDVEGRAALSFFSSSSWYFRTSLTCCSVLEYLYLLIVSLLFLKLSNLLF